MFFFLVCLFVWDVLGFKPSLLSMRGKHSVLKLSTPVWVSEFPALLSARNGNRETATQQPDMWILSFSSATFRPSVATGDEWALLSSLSQGFSSGVRSLKKKKLLLLVSLSFVRMPGLAGACSEGSLFSSLALGLPSVGLASTSACGGNMNGFVL